MPLKFSDGMEFNTDMKEMQPIHESDGWYACGKGMLIPCKDEEDAIAVCKLNNKKEKG